MEYCAFAAATALPSLRRSVPVKSFSTFISACAASVQLPASFPSPSPAPVTPAPTPTVSKQQQQIPPPLRRNDILDVRIESLAYGGAGVARIPSAPGVRDPADDGMLIFTPKGAAPGDLVRVVVVKVRRYPPQLAPPPGQEPPVQVEGSSRAVTTTRQTMNAMDRNARGRAYAEVEFVERLEKSPDSIEPPCKHFGVPSLGGGSCGGCVAMDVEYGRQITEKQAQVEVLFSSLGEHAPDVSKIVRCDKIYNFRNKVRSWSSLSIRPTEHLDLFALSTDS
jgi:predicted RNA-binding protein with TRAM domain